MKKFSVMVILICGLFVLTGCGLFSTISKKTNAHVLKCGREESNKTVYVEAKYNEAETEVNEVLVKTVVEMPKEASDSDIANTKNMLEGTCNSSTMDKCNVSLEGRTFEIVLVGSPQDMDFTDGTIHEVKVNYENAGYTCD